MALGMNPETEQMYETFARYRNQSNMDHCGCCHTDEESLRLITTPLKDLTLDDLDNYAFCAMTTWGSVENFKRFLPRILELAESRHQDFTSLEGVFGKLPYGSWESWPEEERQAIKRFLLALWRKVIRDDGEQGTADTVLCAIAQTEIDLEPFLSAWLAETEPSAARHLAAFTLENSQRLCRKHRLANPFWENREAQEIQVLRWLIDDQPFAFLSAASEDLIGDWNGMPLSEAIPHLRNISRLEIDLPNQPFQAGKRARHRFADLAGRKSKK